MADILQANQITIDYRSELHQVFSVYCDTTKCDMERLHGGVCVVQGCTYKRRIDGKKQQCHKIPKKVDMRSKWLEKINCQKLNEMKTEEITSKELFVCPRHFARNCYVINTQGPNRLKTDAIPTENLKPLQTLENDLGDMQNFGNELSAANKNFPPVSQVIYVKNSPNKVNLLTVEDQVVKKKLSSFLGENIYGGGRSNHLPSFENGMEVTTPPVEENLSFVYQDIKMECSSYVDGNQGGEQCQMNAGPVIKSVSNKVKCLEWQVRPNKWTVWRSVSLLSNADTKLYTELQNKKINLFNARKRLQRCRKKLKNPSDCLETTEFRKIFAKLTEVQQNFVSLIYRNGFRDPSGRRYSKEEQILCLSIYKKSPKAYRYLRTFLPLPAITTLKKLFKKVVIDAGITNETRRRLNEAGQAAKKDTQKAVIIMWDELLLGLNLHYDESGDKVIGFEDLGNVRTEKFADHGLVFMMRFVQSGDIVPISYYFCDKQTTTGQLLYCIKEVAGAVKDAGFNIVATVCDSGTSNQSAINHLLEETEKIRGQEYVYGKGAFVLFDMEIIPLFDPPRLLKCIRNNLLDNDLEFDVSSTKSSTRKFATWKHFVDVYEIDIYGDQNCRFLWKLTDRHIYVNKIKKMDVKTATQVFSNSVASRLEALSGGPERVTSIGKRSIPEEGANTAWICSFFNDLADALNGKVRRDEKSDYRTLMNDNSFHVQFFQQVARDIERMRFVDPVTKEPVPHQTTTLKNLTRTIEGFILLWTKLRCLGFKNLKTGHINQEPVENFFSRIRHCGGTNKKPTCFQFIDCFKTLVINNLSKSYSKNANCIDEGSKFALQWQSYFYSSKGNSTENSTFSSCKLLAQKNRFKYCETEPIPEKVFVSTGLDLILKKMFQKLPSLDSCQQCKTSMDHLAFTPSNSKLKTASNLEEMHSDVESIVRRVLSPVLHTSGIVQETTAFLKKEVDDEIFSCPTHRAEIVHFFLAKSVKQYITSVTAFLISILENKINFDISSTKNPSSFVIRACAKRDSSLKDEHGTFSSLFLHEL